MLLSGIPAKFNIPWGNGAIAPYIRTIPEASQIGIQDGAASLTTGFPPLTFTPTNAGGVPAWGADFNGILNEITSWVRWFSAGGIVPYDAAFQTSIGGYPQGAIVFSASTFGTAYLSTADANTSNPDAGGANWDKFDFLGAYTTGDIKLTLKTAADPGWVMITDGTIGDATSGATYANANAAALYSLVWGNVSNTYAPVSSGRGANAAADFAAHKTIALPKMLGRAIGISGAGSGLTSRALGQTLGEENHTMLLTELVAHTHTYNSAVAGFAPFQAAGPEAGILASNTGSTGSTTPFNVMQPSSFLNAMIKLVWFLPASIPAIFAALSSGGIA